MKGETLLPSRQPGRRIRSVVWVDTGGTLCQLLGVRKRGSEKASQWACASCLVSEHKVFPSRLEGKRRRFAPGLHAQGKRLRGFNEFVPLDGIGFHRWGALERWRAGGGVAFLTPPSCSCTPHHCGQSAKRDTNTFHPRLPQSRLGQMLPRLHSSPHNLSSARGHVQQRSRWERRAVGGSLVPWTSLPPRMVSPSFSLRVSVQHPDLCLPSLPDPEDVHSR